MDKDETIKKLADSLLIMTQMFVAMCDGSPTGKAMDETGEALFAATQHGWKHPVFTKLM